MKKKTAIITGVSAAVTAALGTGAAFYIKKKKEEIKSEKTHNDKSDNNITIENSKTEDNISNE